QPLALQISHQREANSTALHAAVNTSFSTPWRFDELKQPAAENFVTHCLPRSFPFRLRRKWGEL
ncbi:hypothetical protein, partial [Pseudomonas umsongensis]|uniref:hypothetical protein n=1 Tax=Pseudomonas umsongensis TaxID=198618 RepID=UPI00200AF544